MKKSLSLIPLLPVVLAGCMGTGSNDSTVSVTRQQSLAGDWDATLVEAIRRVSPGPTVTARALGIVHTAMYDAWAQFDSVAVGTQIGGTLRVAADQRTEANKKIAISYAAYRALLDLFPTQKSLFDARMTENGYDPTFIALDNTPAGIGNQAAAAIIAFRHTDGSNQLNGYVDTTGYTPVNTVDTVNDPNHWQPIRFSNGAVPSFLTPHWGQVTTFSGMNIAALRPPTPAQFGSQKYLDQATDVVNISSHMGDKEKMIAEYWANGPKSELPPGHWMLFGQWVSKRDQHTLDQDVKMYFLLGNAMLDSSICCWDSKRHFDYVRPITAIRTLFQGQTIMGWKGPGNHTQGLIQGEDWIPFQPGTFITPPFAEYTSGHSTFSAAGAEILTRFTGSTAFGASVSFAPGSSMHDPGHAPTYSVFLNWPTFQYAADEAGMSRRFGGIHFEDGDMYGREMGKTIGELVWNKAQGFFNGSP